QMAEDLADHLALRDNGNEPQGPAVAQRTRPHLQGKHASQEPGPRPIGGSSLRLLPVHSLLARGGDDAPAEMVVWCQTPTIADEVDARQGHERSELLQEFER